MNYRFLILGAGEGGGRLAFGFKAFGYTVAAVNTAKPDLDGLALPDQNKLLLEISQGGTGKDPLVVKNALANPECRQKLTDFVQGFVNAEENKSLLYVLICVGGGGGSGSGLATFVIDTVLEMNVPVGVIYTLPNNDEDVITKSNAVNTFQEIYNTKAVSGAVSPLIIVDNAFMNKMGIPIKDFYTILNRKIAENIHRFNSFSGLPSKYFSAVDTLDFGRVLSLGGVCSLGKMTVVNTVDFSLVQDLMKESLFVEGINLMSAKGAAVIVSAPEFILSDANVSNCIHFIFEEVARLVGGGIVFRGVYEDPSISTLDVYLIFNGMTFPADRFNRMWADIKAGHASVKRKEKRIDEMTFAIDESLMPTQSFQKIKAQSFRVVACNNCIINPLTRVSTHRYNGTGSIPFTAGRCPRCGGRGVYEIK